MTEKDLVAVADGGAGRPTGGDACCNTAAALARSPTPAGHRWRPFRAGVPICVAADLDAGSVAFARTTKAGVYTWRGAHPVGTSPRRTGVEVAPFEARV